MKNAFDILKERGFTEQTTHEEEIRELLGKNLLLSILVLILLRTAFM